MKILLAEDDLLIANQLKEDLEDAGHEVVGIARNPIDALTLLKKNSPELAILDITLESGNNDGLDLADLIPDIKDIPFIFLSGHSEKKILKRAGNAKSYGYVLKPYCKELLLMQVQLAYDRFMEQARVSDVIEESFYIKTNGFHEKVRFEDLIYVKSNRHSVSIYTTKNVKPYIIGTNLSEIVKYFRHPNLLYLSPSLIVNKIHIQKLFKKTLILDHLQEDIEISDSGRKVLMTALNILKTKSVK